MLPSKVVDPVGGRTFKTPKLNGYAELLGPPFGELATHTTASTLWIGVGRGEWGGAFLGLDAKAEMWKSSADGLNYATDITHVADGEVVVSWSMNHFTASTLIRVHKADAKVKTEYPALQQMYCQRVAYSPFDDVVYGIENADLVIIADGKPSKVATLDGRLHEREPHAIGVAPGIVALLPAGRRTIFIVPNQGNPWRVENERVTRLGKP